MLITSFGPISWTVCIIANFATDLSRIPPRALVCSVLREEFQALLWFRGLTGRLFFYLPNGCSRGCFWRKRSSPLKAQTCKKKLRDINTTSDEPTARRNSHRNWTWRESFRTTGRGFSDWDHHYHFAFDAVRQVPGGPVRMIALDLAGGPLLAKG